MLLESIKQDLGKGTDYHAMSPEEREFQAPLVTSQLLLIILFCSQQKTQKEITARMEPAVCGSD